MHETSSTSAPQAGCAATNGRSGNDSSFVTQYRLDHTNPVNHFLLVGVGWPMMALAVILVPFRPLWSAALFVAAYAIMFFGHFVFERNKPTIFKEPSTPFVIAYSVICNICGALVRLAKPQRGG